MYQRPIAPEAACPVPVAIAILLLAGCGTHSRGDESAPAFRYCYCLFEQPGKVEGGSDCYIPLLVAREPLEQGRPPEVAVIITYERNSIWKFREDPSTLDVDAVQPEERTVHFEGKVYRYQRIPSEEAVHLLEQPLGTIPVHRQAPPINAQNDRLRQVLLKDLAAREDSGETRQAPARELGSLIGKNWKDVWVALQPQGVTIFMERTAKDGRLEYILGGKNDKSASFTVRTTNGRIDEVEAWSPYQLKPLFPTIVGSVGPGTTIETIEKDHGEPILVEYGAWPGPGGELRMKGWMLGDYLVFVTNRSGQKLTAEAERVYAFRKDVLPKDRRLFTDARVTLETLARGERHIESPSSEPLQLTPAAPAGAMLTPDTMARHGFHIECRFIDDTITEGAEPTRPTGLVLVQVSFDAEKGPAIKGIESSSLVVRDGDSVLLSVPVKASAYPESKGIRHVQFSIHKDMLPKAQILLNEGGQGRPRTFAVDLKSFVKDK